MTVLGCSDINSCIRESVLAVGSGLTFIGLSYAFYRRACSSHGRSNRDLFVIFLSLIQTFLSMIYYALQDYKEIVLAARVIKVLQTLVISWIFLAAILPGRRSTHVLCGIATVQVIIIYSFLIALWEPEDSLCRDTTWVFVSIAWFLVSLLVSLAGIRLISTLTSSTAGGQSVLIPSQTPEDAVQSDDQTSVRIIDGRSDSVKNSKREYHSLPNSRPVQKGFTPVELSTTSRQASEERLIVRDLSGTLRLSVVPTVDPDYATTIHDEVVIGHQDEDVRISSSSSRRESSSSMEGVTQIDVKKQQLLALVAVETFSAGVTMIWDVIIWISVEEEADTCNHFLSHIPVMESVVYLISRTVSLLVPHWAVFFVFYWFDRNLHLPYSPQWDIDLRGVELGTLPPVPLPT